jgi:hypothetical protein
MFVSGLAVSVTLALAGLMALKQPVARARTNAAAAVTPAAKRNARPVAGATVATAPIPLPALPAPTSAPASTAPPTAAASTAPPPAAVVAVPPQPPATVPATSPPTSPPATVPLTVPPTAPPTTVSHAS